MSNIVLELDITDTVASIYIRGINLIYADVGTVAYYLYNAHSDVVQLTSETGSLTKTYEYDAFGNEKNADENDTNPFRYCGEYFDKETGTIYLRARYYDPVIGRFITEDSYWGEAGDPLSLNLYTYCNGNPIIYFNPSGHKAGYGDVTYDDSPFNTSNGDIEGSIPFWYGLRKKARDIFVNRLGPVWGWYEAISGKELFTGIKLTEEQRIESDYIGTVRFVNGLIGLSAGGGIEDVTISISQIYFMQSSIKNLSKDGNYTVLENAKALKMGSLGINDMPTIRVWKDTNEKIWTLDHRRLAAFKLAGEEIPVQWVTEEYVRNNEWFKMTTYNDGASIKLKLGDGEIMTVK